MCTSFGEKQILETKCIKQHAFLVDPRGSSHALSNTHALMFLYLKRRVQTKKGTRNLASSQTSQKGPFRPKKGANTERPFRVLRDERSPGRVCHPVLPLEGKVKSLGQMITFMHQETFEVQHRIRRAWSAFAKHRHSSLTCSDTGYISVSLLSHRP